MPVHETPPATLNPTQARQSFRDRPVLMVLTASLLLVCAAFAAAYFLHWPA
ncbi:MAG TPA: hypothetical protein VHA55_09640 [Pseudorhodoplanes sp.]|nr:hypothetical protein [Pseudorhodoplanes sp.]